MNAIELWDSASDGKSVLADVVDIGGRSSLVDGPFDASRGCDTEFSMVVERDGGLPSVGQIELMDLRVASSFDAEGKFISTTVVAVELGENVERFEWRGREVGAETGLQYNRARHFDPHQGRWLVGD
jgi:hypothetical protein